MAKHTPRKFIKGAIKRPGDLTRKAKAAGKTVNEFCQGVLKKGSKADTRTKRQCNFAVKVLKKVRSKSKRKS